VWKREERCGGRGRKQGSWKARDAVKARPNAGAGSGGDRRVTQILKNVCGACGTDGAYAPGTEGQAIRIGEGYLAILKLESMNRTGEEERGGGGEERPADHPGHAGGSRKIFTR
jgi:hypothetical protein